MTSRKDKNTQAIQKIPKHQQIHKSPYPPAQLLTTVVEMLVQENNCPFQGDVEQKDSTADR